MLAVILNGGNSSYLEGMRKEECVGMRYAVLYIVSSSHRYLFLGIQDSAVLNPVLNGSDMNRQRVALPLTGKKKSGHQGEAKGSELARLEYYKLSPIQPFTSP